MGALFPSLGSAFPRRSRRARTSSLLRGEAESTIAALCAELLSHQHSDGSWPGGRNLRVTDSDCHEPWIESRGEFYEDLAGTITTAVVVSVLTEVLCDEHRTRWGNDRRGGRSLDWC